MKKPMKITNEDSVEIGQEYGQPIKTVSLSEDNPVSSRLKVLVAAASVHPLKGSEGAMGWNWILSLSKYCDLWVITGENAGNREPIEEYFAKKKDAGSRCEIYFIPRHHPAFITKLFPPLYYYYYNKWHKKAFILAKKLSRGVCFDLVHQLNMIGYREPGYLWKFHLPFIWGPIGGHVQMPWRFLPILGNKSGFFYVCRNIINAIQMRFSKRVKKAMGRAVTLIAATKEDQAAIHRFHRRESVLINETGTGTFSLQNNERPISYCPEDRELHVCWSGLFVGRKALPLALYALAKVRDKVNLKFHIIGDGPEKKAWHNLALKLGIESMCVWHGWVDRQKALEIISTSDILLFTSIQDATSNVVLEALNSAVPVICHDACGFGTVIDETCGLKIPMVSPQKSIHGFAEAISKLANNPALLERLSKGAILQAKELTWDNKAKQMLVIYNQAIQKKRTKS